MSHEPGWPVSQCGGSPAYSIPPTAACPLELARVAAGLWLLTLALALARPQGRTLTPSAARLATLSQAQVCKCNRRRAGRKRRQRRLPGHKTPTRAILGGRRPSQAHLMSFAAPTEGPTWTPSECGAAHGNQENGPFGSHCTAAATKAGVAFPSKKSYLFQKLGTFGWEKSLLF